MDPVEEQLAAYNEGKIERFLACYASDVTIEDSEGKVIMSGLEEMRARYERLFDRNPDLHCRIVKRIRVGDYVIDEEEVTGFSAEDAPKVLRAVAIYHLAGDKIINVRFLP